MFIQLFLEQVCIPNISPIAFLVDRCENVYISGWGGCLSYSNNSLCKRWDNRIACNTGCIKSEHRWKGFLFFCFKKEMQRHQLFGSFFGENNTQMAGCDHVDGGTSRFDQNGVIYQAICANCEAGWLHSLSNYTGAGATVNNTWSRSCNLAMLKIAFNLAGVASGVQSSINGVPRDSAGCVPLTVDFSDTIRNAVEL